MTSDEKYACAYHSDDKGNHTPHNQLETCINGLSGWVADNNLTDETMLVASNMTSMTGASGGNNNGTIRMASTVSKILSFITDGFDSIRNFLAQNISPTGANDSQTMISSFASTSDVRLRLSD